MDKYIFGQPLYAHGEWWTLVQPLSKGTDCFLVIERGDALPADILVVKQFESDREYERDHKDEI